MDKKVPRPLFSRCIVFNVPKRYRTKSGLFVGNAMRDAFKRIDDIWILAQGAGCDEIFPRGTRAIIQDGFELDPTNLNLWGEWKDDEAFKTLRAFVEEVDGEVHTQIVSQGSILGVYED